MIINKNNYKDEILAATALLLSVSKADENIDNNEIDLINTIITDFFKVDHSHSENIINTSLNILNKSTDIYEFGKTLNESFTYGDKVDFICCAFEVAYSDGELHYFEEHMIKKIATILNVNHQDLIESKIELVKVFSPEHGFRGNADAGEKINTNTEIH